MLVVPVASDDQDAGRVGVAAVRATALVQDGVNHIPENSPAAVRADQGGQVQFPAPLLLAVPLARSALKTDFPVQMLKHQDTRSHAPRPWLVRFVAHIKKNINRTNGECQ